MAEYQVSMTETGDASIINLDNPLEYIIIKRVNTPFVARDLLAILGYRTDYTRAQLRDGTGFHPNARFAQVSA